MKKKILIALGALVLIGVGAWYFLIFTKPTEDTEITTVSKETKVEDIFQAITTEDRYSDFKDFIGTTDLKTKTAPAAETDAQNSVIVFAPSKAAFDKEEIAPLKDVPANLIEELRLYHVATLKPAEDGTKPSLELKDGQKIATIAGREILVSKKGSLVTLTDAKGRTAKVSASYTVDASGDRIYTIDNVLLLQ